MPSVPPPVVAAIASASRELPSTSVDDLVPIELPLPAVPPPCPSGVTLKLAASTSATGGAYRANTRAPTGFDISWRGAAGGRFVIATAIVWDLATVLSFVLLPLTGIVLVAFALAAVIVTLKAVNVLRSRTRLVATDGTIFVHQRIGSKVQVLSLPVDAVSRFYCEQSSIITGSVSFNDGPHLPTRRAVHHVCAMTGDGRKIRLVVDVERQAVALYVTTLLQQRLESSPS